MIKHIFHTDTQDAIQDVSIQTSSAVNGFVDQHGIRKYDATMGWYSYPLGFQRHDIVDYVADTLKHIAFDYPEGHMSSTVRRQLSEKLYQLTPGYYSLFGLTGSDSVEAAIYTSGLYHNDVQKKIILSLEISYHGSTELCISISGIRDYKGGIKHSKKIPIVDYDRFGKHAERMFLHGLANTINEIGADNISCFVIEFCAWASGLHTYSKELWRDVQNICQQNNIILIVDDVAMCGGKTGRFFGVDFDQVQPDIVCAGKALAGGYFPLSATLLSPRVYERIKTQRFGFGFTYSASISGMASALKYISILEQERILEQVPTAIANYQKMLDQFKQSGVVEYYRNFGTIFLIKFNDDLTYELAYRDLDLYHPILPLDQTQSNQWIFSLPLVDSELVVEQLTARLNSFSLDTTNA
jgi:putrescine aminotransferase